MKKILCMLFVSLSFFARAQIRDTLIVQPNDVKVELDDKGYHHITYGDNYVVEAGAPELPLVSKHYYIPRGAGEVQLTAIALDEIQKDGVYNVYPSQGLIPTNQAERPFVELSEEWSAVSYPTTFAEIISDNSIMGYRVVTVSYHPFAFCAGNGLLTMRNIAISLEYTIEDIPETENLQSSYRKNKCKEYIKSLVENSDLLEDSSTSSSASAYSREVPIRLFGEGRPIPDFIIITNEELKPAFRPLAEWKTRRGIYTIIETTEYIDSVCPGIDLCEKIRNYIKEKEEHWGEGLAILLGGGIDIIPSRTYKGVEGVEVTDVYYIDNNKVFPNPSNDFSKISFNSTIGRFPVNNIEEARILVQKSLAYEWASCNSLDYGYVNNTLVVSAYLEVDKNVGYMFKHLNYVKHTPNKRHWFLFDDFNNFHGAEGQGEELSRESFLGALSNGADSINQFHFIYHLDHSGPFSMGASLRLKGENITADDITHLNFTTDYYQVVLSEGCHPADFSTSCIAKSFLMQPSSGAIVFMGNTDVGWSNEHFGLDVFYKTMFGDVKWDWETRIDNVWKNYLIHENLKNTKSRFHILGDPTLSFWSETPEKYQNSYSKDGHYLTVTRPDNLVGKGSTICIYKEDEVYMIDTLCTEKEQLFYLQDIQTSGYVYITTTGIGQIPQRDSIYFDAREENLLEIANVELIREDNRGQANVLFPGETFSLQVTYRALKNNIPSNVVLKTEPVEDNLYVERLSQNTTIGRILQQGDTCQYSFMFRVRNDVPNLSKHNKNELEFRLSYSNNVYNSLGKHSVDVIKPELFVHSMETNLISDNLYDVKICLSTNGVTPFVGETVTFTSVDNSIMIEDSVSNFDVVLNHGNICELIYRVKIDNSATNSPNCVLSVHDAYGNLYSYAINPLANRPQSPSKYDISFYGGEDYIDIAGDFSQVICTTTGETFDIPYTNSNYVCFRHQPLESNTGYNYKLKRKKDGLESVESTGHTCYTKDRILNNFPNVVENASAFIGPINSWDVNHDGNQEIFGATWDYLEENGSLIAVRASGEDLFNDKDNHVIEPFAPTQGNFRNGVAIGELYDDGEQYLVSVTYSGANSVYCHKTSDNDGDGFPDLYWKKDTVLIKSKCSPIISDLDGDNISEVIVPSKGNLIIFEANGEIRNVIMNLDDSYRQPAVASIIPNSKGKQLIVPDGKNLNVYDANGEKISNYSISLSATVSSPIICDYDNDGYKEAITGELVEKDTKDYKDVLDSIYICAVKYNNTGVSKKKLFGYTRHLSGRNDAPFVMGDLNNDEKLEIVTISHSIMKEDSLIKYNTSSNKKVIASLASSSKGDYKELCNTEPCAIILLDTDGDSTKEVIYPEGEKCCFLSSSEAMFTGSTELLGTMHTSISKGLIASDIDNDGFTEIICGTKSGRLYVWKTKGSPNDIEWGYSRGNPQNTGEYGKVSFPQFIRNESYSESYTVAQDLYILGGQVTFSDTVSFEPNRKIVVWETGVLNIDGAILNNARIVVKPGGRVNITNGSIINLRDPKSLIVPKGAQLRMANSRIIN